MKKDKATLINRIEVQVKFSEVDSMGVVWHGNYIRYFEDGREAFGNQFGISYLDVQREGFSIPVVNVHCDYKKAIRYGEKFIIETKYIDSEAAKLMFEYTLLNKDTNEILAKGSSTQVFLIDNQSLSYTIPAFFEKWKRKWL